MLIQESLPFSPDRGAFPKRAPLRGGGGGGRFPLFEFALLKTIVRRWEIILFSRLGRITDSPRQKPGRRVCSALKIELPHTAKSINPRCGSVEISLAVTLSPTSRPLLPRTTMPSTGGLSVRTNVPLLVTPVTMAGKL